MTASRAPRIAIYGVGQYGTMIARLAAERGWPIAAAFNRAGPKVGQDLGRIAGLGRDLGVIVQDCESGDYAALDADIGDQDLDLIFQDDTTGVLSVRYLNGTATTLPNAESAPNGSARST